MRKKITSLVLIGFVFSTFCLLLLFPQTVSATPCEDYCYEWFFECMQQGGGMEYCTNGMMDCLFDNCGWAEGFLP